MAFGIRDWSNIRRQAILWTGRVYEKTWNDVSGGQNLDAKWEARYGRFFGFRIEVSATASAAGSGIILYPYNQGQLVTSFVELNSDGEDSASAWPVRLLLFDDTNFHYVVVCYWEFAYENWVQVRLSLITSGTADVEIRLYLADLINMQ